LKKVIKENFKEEKPLWHWFRMGEICNWFGFLSWSEDKLNSPLSMINYDELTEGIVFWYSLSEII
jgi:hypothetical protein